MQASGIRPLLLIAALFLSFVLTHSSAAQNAGQTVGMNPPYFSISPTLKATATEKLEVVEVFNYSCNHCFRFQDQVDEWLKKLDTKKVEFVYMPSPYKDVDTLLARGYLAAKSLGVSNKTHHAMFQAIHERGVQVRSLNDVAALYTQLGVPSDKIAKALKDFSVDAELRRTYDLMVKYRVDSTPTLIIAGKYRVTVDTAGSMEAMLKVADKLIAQELNQKPK